MSIVSLAASNEPTLSGGRPRLAYKSIRKKFQVRQADPELCSPWSRGTQSPTTVRNKASVSSTHEGPTATDTTVGRVPAAPGSENGTRGRLQTTGSPELVSKCLHEARGHRNEPASDTPEAYVTDENGSFIPVCCPEEEEVQSFRFCRTGRCRLSIGKDCNGHWRDIKPYSQKKD